MGPYVACILYATVVCLGKLGSTTFTLKKNPFQSTSNMQQRQQQSYVNKSPFHRPGRKSSAQCHRKTNVFLDRKSIVWL